MLMLNSLLSNSAANISIQAAGVDSFLRFRSNFLDIKVECDYEGDIERHVQL
jgi:hypothetical protein